MLKRAAILLVAIFLLIPALHAEILTWYSDQGTPNVPPNSVITYPFPPESGDVWDGTSTIISPPEGVTNFLTSETSKNFVGWGVQLAKAQDLSRFKNGQFVFWINSTSPNVEIQIKNANKELVLDTSLALLKWDPKTMANQWVQIAIPFAPLTAKRSDLLSSVLNPCLFTATVGPATFYVDNVHYTDSSVLPTFNVVTKNRSDNSVTNNLSWTNVNLPSGWQLADQYISAEVDPSTFTWGLQLYTDNTSAGANPRYTGLISTFTQTPAGLVDKALATNKLPLAWATRSDVSTITVVAAEPNNTKDPNSFQWFYFEDRAQIAVPNLQNPVQSISPFFNGDPFITAANNVGIHFGQDPVQFGPADPPLRIYLEADFSNALTPKTYQTSTLTLELFYL